MKYRVFSLDWEDHWGSDCYRVEYYNKEGAWVGRTWHTFFVMAFIKSLLWTFFGKKTDEIDQKLNF